VQAVDDDGLRVRLVVDAISGEVIQMRPAYRAARAYEFDPPPRPPSRIPARGARSHYPPEWGEAPPPSATPRRGARTPDLGSGPSVIYAPDRLMPDVQPRRSSRPAPVPVARPPMPRARPNDLASMGGPAPQQAKPVPPPETEALAPPVAEPAAPVAEKTPERPAVPTVAPPF
jgi:hypothetical protein